MNEISIYALVDPRKPEVIRYIGQTANPLARHRMHCSSKGLKSKRSQWLNAIRAEGIMPQMIILKVVQWNAANQEENNAIGHHASEHLCNERSQTCTRIPDAVRSKGLLRAGLDEIERRSIQDACEAERWNLTHVAHNLGISRPTLYDKMERYQIARP